MRDGERVLNRLRWQLERFGHIDEQRVRITELLDLLSPLAMAPERHAPSIKECAECFGTGHECVDGDREACVHCKGTGAVVDRSYKCGPPDCYQCWVWPAPEVVWPPVAADVARMAQLSLFADENVGGVGF